MTASLDGLALLAWTHFWQVTAAATAVGLTTRLLGRNRPRLAYALWMLVVVKALTPPIWSSPTGVFSWALAVREPAPTARTEIGEAPVLISDPRTVPATVDYPPVIATDDRLSTQAVLLAIWGVGLFVFSTLAIGKQAACSILIRRSKLPAREDLPACLEDLRGRLGVSRKVKLIVSSRPIGPAAFGLLRPTIVLPEILLPNQTREQVELIVAHELVHIKRGDILAGYVQLAAQIVWWFHPLIWWANREATRERERCCDRDVIEGMDCRPTAYARTLLSIVELKSRLRIPASMTGVRAMEVTSRRLETIMRPAEHRGRWGSWPSRLAFVCGVMLLIPGAGLTLPAGADDKPKVETAKTTTTAPAERIQPATETTSERQRRARQRLEQDMAALRNEISVAQSEVQRARDRVDWAKLMEKSGYLSKGQRVNEELSFQQAKFRLRQTEIKLKVLAYFDRRKTAVSGRGEDEAAIRHRALSSVHTKVPPGIILKGVAREKGTGRPVRGASITVQARESAMVTVTDKAGRYEFIDLPEAPTYGLVGSPKTGEPFFITSTGVKPAEGQKRLSADLEFVPGIPFHVKVLDRRTGEAIKGDISYFPAYRNALKPGVVGYLGNQENGGALGAFYEAVPERDGEYLGAVLPGPGILGFRQTIAAGKQGPTDRNPVFLYPDGDDGQTVLRDNSGKPFGANVPASLDGNSKPRGMASLTLPQYDAVIVINPKEDAKEVAYEITLDQAEASK